MDVEIGYRTGVATSPAASLSHPERFSEWRALVARRPGLTCLIAGLLPVVLRLALLPVMPIPAPSSHDEFSYLLGADTFASGRLTNPPHPMWVHFETFHVNQQPTYASKYPPAQALFLAFGQEFLGHPWFGVCLSVGLMMASFCWMLEGWVRPGYAFWTTCFAILAWGITGYWMNSYWGGAVAAIGGALVVGAVPRLIERVSTGSVLLASVGILLLANSRPYEGLLTIASSAAVLLYRRHRQRISLGALLRRRAVLAFLLVLAPGVAAMAYYNYRVTGSPLLLPYVVNEKTYAAAPRFYFSPSIPIPVYRHEVIRRLWVEWDRQIYLNARANPLTPLRFAAPFVVPFFLVNVLSVAALIGLLLGKGPARSGALAILSLPVAGLLLQKTFLPHYCAPMCGAYLILAAAGLETAARRRTAGVLLAGLAMGNLMLMAHTVYTAGQPRGGIETRPQLEERLERQGGKHLIVVRYGPDHDVHREWVYNRADIDHSNVVWAREMADEKNRELLAYYRDRQAWLLEPDRNPTVLTPYSVTGPR